MKNPQAWDGVVIAGYGEAPYHRRQQEHVLWYLADSVRRALVDAEIKPSDVDGLSATAFSLPPDNATTLAHHLGLDVRWVHHGVHGGASAIIGVLEAIRAIQAGDAQVVVVVAADAFTVDGHMDLLDRFNRPMRDYLGPYSYGGPNGIFALVQRRHMYEYGTKREQLGALAVAQRRNAAGNDNALLRGPLTLDDYLNARMIADPIGLYDCVLPCAGGGAVVLMAEDLAKEKGIRVIAGGQRHNYLLDEVVVLDTGFQTFAASLFDQAELGPSDMHFVQLYDDYPIMEVIQLEDLGFCEKGEGGTFVERTNLEFDGTFPVNTGGGQLSAGQCGAGGGIIGLVEGVRQLSCEGGDRQCPTADVGLIAGFGMVGYGRGLSTSALILAN